MAKTSVHGSMVADDTLDLDAVISGDKSGADDAIITGTIPANGRAVMANSDGDLIDAGFAASAIYRSGGTDVALGDGGTGQSLVDPNDDRGLFWDDSAAAVAFFAPANGLEFSTTNLQMTQNQRTAGIPLIIDGGGSAITTGVKAYLPIPFACTIFQVDLIADQSGSIVIDIWKDTFANAPPDDADSITASAPPTLSSAQKSTDSTLSGWTTAIAAGDVLGFNVDSVTTVERVTLMLHVRKT